MSERERIVGNDAGAGHEVNTGGKSVLAEEIAGQVLRFALQHVERGLPLKDN